GRRDRRAWTAPAPPRPRSGSGSARARRPRWRPGWRRRRRGSAGRPPVPGVEARPRHLLAVLAVSLADVFAVLPTILGARPPGRAASASSAYRLAISTATMAASKPRLPAL